VGDDGWDVGFDGFFGVDGEEAGDGSFSFEHVDLLERCAGECLPSVEPRRCEAAARSGPEPVGTLVLYQI
jgi:hypothetical protein